MSTVGYKWQLSVSAAGGSPSYQVVGFASDVELKQPAELVDTTTRADSGWRNCEQGVKSWQVSVKHLWVPTDAAYTILRSAYLNGTKVLCQFRDSSAGGAKGHDGTAIVTGMTEPQKLHEAVILAINLNGCGALTDV